MSRMRGLCWHAQPGHPGEVSERAGSRPRAPAWPLGGANREGEYHRSSVNVTNEANGTAPAISDDDVSRPLPALAEAERASAVSTPRFVPPRQGFLKRHLIADTSSSSVTAGVGKTTLLRR